MADPTTVDTSAQSLKVGIANNAANAIKERACYADTSAPSAPSAGWRWIDSSTATRLVMQVYQNGGWVNCVLTHLLEENLDFDKNEAVKMLLENLATGSLPAAAASDEGRVCWDTTVERVAAIGSTSQRYLAEVNVDGSTFVRIPTTLNVASLGDAAVANTSTIWGGWGLTTAAKELNVIAGLPVPAGYTAVAASAKDITLEVDCALLAAETANDDIDMDGTWEANTDGAALGDDQVAFAAVTHDIGSNNGQYDLHRVSLTLDYDAPSANVAAGDRLVATINHDATGEVAGVIVTGAFFKVPVLNFNS